MVRISKSLSALWLAALLTGCGADARNRKAPTEPSQFAVTTPAVGASKTPPVEPASRPVAAAEPWGTIKGRIIWGGKDIPKRMPVTVPETHNDHRFCTKDGAFLEDTWIVDAKSKGLKNVFIWLAPTEVDGKLNVHPARQKTPDSEKTLVIDQPVCMFVPHALAIREGQVLVVKNSAKVPHSFKWGGSDANPGGNRTIAAGDQLEVAIKAERNLIPIGCALHLWMTGAILAFDHPYFAVTDAEGRFEIKNAPAGACRLMIRHSTGIWLGGAEGRKGKAVTIQPGDNDLGALEYPPPQ